MISPLGGIRPTHFGVKPEHYAQLTEGRALSARATQFAPRTSEGICGQHDLPSGNAS